MPDSCPKGTDLGVKPSAPPCPPTLLRYPGLQTEIQTASVSVETQSEIQTASVSWETQIEIQTVQIEAQTTPVSVLQTTLVSIEIQTIQVRDEMEDRRQRDKEKQVSPIYPWDMRRAARETEEQQHKLLPLHEVPTARNNQSLRVNKPFLIKKYKESRRIWETI